MKYTNATYKRAFTLIEVLISHYQKKALLKQGKKEIVQSIYEARNLAINGLEVGNNNVSIWLYIDARDTSNKILQYYSYDNLDTDFLPSAFPAAGTVNLLKENLRESR